MKLIVCLGNIGKEYENTRHNVGFMIADFYADSFQLESKFRAYVYQGILNETKYMVIKPTTYMNDSGLSVAKVAQYYDISPVDILVIQDDMDLPLGSYKLKRNSSSGGHNGIQSIINAMQTNSFLRLKVGVGHDRSMDTISYVLGNFSKKEKQLLVENFSTYQQIIEKFILDGVERTLQMYSKK